MCVLLLFNVFVRCSCDVLCDVERFGALFFLLGACACCVWFFGLEVCLCASL